MDVDSTVDPNVTSSGFGSVTVELHPLVILNISEHWTRNKVKENSSAVSVYGVLLGKQVGNCIEVSNSFELLLDQTNSSVNTDFYNSREAQCKQIYPELDVVGWYTTGGAITECDKLFNRQMLDLNKSLLILKLDPIVKSCGEEFPVRIYESVIDNDGCIQSRQVTYNLATDETERIGVDSVARISMAGTDQGTSMTAEHLSGNYQAIQMLCKRIHLIRSYVLAVHSGELPANHARLREISALTKRLKLLCVQSPDEDNGNSDVPPNRTPNELDKHLFRQANDVSLASLLASLTQGMHSMHDCMSKAAQAVDRRTGNISMGSGYPHMPYPIANV